MIQVLERAFGVLDVLAQGERSLAYLTRATGLQKTTLHNILKTLEALGVVARTDGGKYALGAKLFRLAEPQIKQGTLQPIAQKAADRLAARINESVFVSVLRGSEHQVIARATGTQSVTVHIEEALSPYGVCAGRVLLAYLDGERLRAVAAARGLPGAEWNHIKSQRALETALREIRSDKIAAPLSPDGQVRTLAVPVRGPDRTVWAAISIPMPAARFVGSRQYVIEDALSEAATEMQDALELAFDPVLRPAVTSG